MFEQISATLAKPGSKRTHQPVRRNSRHVGKCEAVFWKRTDRQEVRQIVLAARRYELGMKQPGQKNGPLGSVAIEVLEYFANTVDFRSGRLDPSLDTIMEKLCRSRDAIWKALKALQEHGFVDWMRRYIPTGNQGAGPQVQQTSNAYKMSLPARAKAMLGKYAKPAPKPEDFEQARQEREEAIAAHKASQTAAERIRDMDIDPALAERAAARLERRQQQQNAPAETPVSTEREQPSAASVRSAVDRIRQKFSKERESVKRTESRSRFIE